MAGMSTVLTEFSDMGNVRKWQLSGHSVSQPRQLIQKRTEAPTPAGLAKSSLTFLYGTKDSQDVPLAARTAVDISIRYPANGDPDDVTAILAVVRDIVASDEFTSMVNTQAWLKA